jgi:hypothetical protein
MPAMDREVKFEMTAALWEAAARRMWRQFVWRYAQWGLVILIFAFLALPRVAGFRGLVAAVFLAMVAAGALGIAYGVSLKTIRWRAAALGRGPQVYRITDAGLSVPTSSGEVAYPWKQFHRLVRSRAVWLLFHGKATALFLPAEAVAGDVGEFLVSKVRESGGEVK